MRALARTRGGTKARDVARAPARNRGLSNFIYVMAKITPRTATAMARRSTALIASAQSTSRKRSSLEPHSTPARASKRVAANEVNHNEQTKITPTKSRYFEHDTDEESESDISGGTSAYEDEDRSAVSTPPDSESEAAVDDDEDSFSEHEAKAKRRGSQKKRATAATAATSAARLKVTDGQEMWRPGVTTGLGPGKQVVIKLPKPRAAGSTPYRPDTIHPNTLLFLKDLAKNNDREWLKCEVLYITHSTSPNS